MKKVAREGERAQKFDVKSEPTESYYRFVTWQQQCLCEVIAGNFLELATSDTEISGDSCSLIPVFSHNS